MKYNKVFSTLKHTLELEKNITYSHLKFFTYHQEPGQIFKDYLTVTRKLISDYDLLELHESLLRDMLVKF